MSIKIHIEKSYPSFNLKIDLDSNAKSLALLGASGCGKSLTLKCIAGIIRPDKGRIVVNNRVLFDSEKKINVKPQERNVGYLFQNYALFPNMSVFQNIRCGLKKFKYSKEKEDEIIQNYIKTLSLEGYENHKPFELSGGQQQRVALARVLASKPNLILLDEPFSALDEHLKIRLELETKEILNKFGVDMIFVSHNRDEVYRICEETCAMENGEAIITAKTPILFANPQYLSASILTGCKNNIPVTIKDEHILKIVEWGIEIKTKQVIPSDTKYLGIRAHHFSPGSESDGYPIKIVHITEEPFERLVQFRFKKQIETSPDLYWLVPKDMDVENTKYLKIKEKDLLFLK